MDSDIKTLVSKLEDAGQFFFPKSREIVIPYQHPLGHKPDPVEQLYAHSFRSMYYDPIVRKIMAPELLENMHEISSGNNDLGYFRTLLKPCFAAFTDSPQLNNYTAGRGNYFILEKLIEIENAWAKSCTGHSVEYSVNNIALTFGGQGGYAAVAGFLSLPQNIRRKVLFFDSHYYANYKPFMLRGLNLEFAKSNEFEVLPSAASVSQRISGGDISALFLVKFHNPSGDFYNEASLRQIITALRDAKSYLIYAEAYETLGFQEKKTLLEVLRLSEELNFEGLIRVKTLAKERGFAGLRAGYVIGPTEVVDFIWDFNNEIAFNPAQSNNHLLVLTAYLQLKTYFEISIPHIENWLKTFVDLDFAFHTFSRDETRQLNDIKDNSRFIIESLTSQKNITLDGGEAISGNGATIFNPQGGFNLLVRLDFIRDYDQIDMFRKIFLNTGLVWHGSSFLFRKSGSVLRITTAHPRTTLERVITLIKKIREEPSYYDFLPANSIRAIFVKKPRTIESEWPYRIAV